jgi:hypothetical protein
VGAGVVVVVVVGVVVGAVVGVFSYDKLGYCCCCCCSCYSLVYISVYQSHKIDLSNQPFRLA